MHHIEIVLLPILPPHWRPWFTPHPGFRQAPKTGPDRSSSTKPRKVIFWDTDRVFEGLANPYTPSTTFNEFRLACERRSGFCLRFVLRRDVAPSPLDWVNREGIHPERTPSAYDGQQHPPREDNLGRSHEANVMGCRACGSVWSQALLGVVEGFFSTDESNVAD
ncbi:hypothetical protein B0H34DRAFT_677004 [Crassisporium funariophilum]|nr:hypothetical protein B0H34DRAFT_677004 [Crassisporium funariophilum]